MRTTAKALLGSLVLAAVSTAALAQTNVMNLPRTVEAGSAFSIKFGGSGTATLYILAPGQVLKRDVQLGTTTYFPSGSLYNAGHYLVLLREASSTENGSFDVVPAAQPAQLTFLARPSRLAVGLHDGITGAAYVFDVYHNLITTPATVSFDLTNPTGNLETRSVVSRDGAAWTQMDSSAQQGRDRFVARVGDISSTRVIAQVPGDPCGLKMSARPSGRQIHLETAPVLDCNSNAVPDGTIVTFTEDYNGAQSTVDVPLKHGIAEVDMPEHAAATISVACGVVLGNQIRVAK